MMKFEKLSLTNVESALELCKNNFGEDCNDFDITSVLNKSSRYNNCFVVLDDDLVVGLIVGTPIKTPFDKLPMIYISYVCTHKNYRGLGIAKNLVKYLIDYCKTHLGAKEYLLHTVKGNTVAESVYRSVGFTEDVNGFYLKV